MRTTDPLGSAIYVPRGMNDRIHCKALHKMTHSECRSFRFYDFREEDFFHVLFHYKPMTDNTPSKGGMYGPNGHCWQDF